VAASGDVGTVTHGGISFTLTGVEAAGSVGSVGVVKSFALSGVQAAGSVGSVIAIYWILVDDSETSNWQNVNNSQSSSWILVETS
jgi:hypothetical protein